MAREDARLRRTVSLAARVLTAAAVVLPPAIYFVVSYEHAAGVVEAEAEINARLIGRIVSTNPDLWEYEQVRYSEYLARRPATGDAERRRVLGARGAVVAENADPLPTPLLTRSVPLFDAGVRVGAIEISRSLRPLLVRSGILLVGLLAVGILSYRAVRTVPLRALRRGEEAQSQLEEQLRKAQKLEAIGRLAGGVAHDFNNVLAVIKAKAGLLRRQLPEEDPRRRWVDDILASADRAASLTGDLLTFGRRRVPRREPVDLVEQLRRFEPSLRALVREGIDLRVAVPAQPLPVMAESLDLERVLMNLVTNARDAMPEGGRIAIAASRATLDANRAAAAGVEAPGPYAELTVADTGTGIPPGVMANLFEPFFTTKAPGKGTGLGLSVAYAIMKQHHGAIHVASEPGKGATFTLLLPLLAEQPSPAAPPPSASA